MKLLSHVVVYNFNFLRNLHMVFHSDFTMYNLNFSSWRIYLQWRRPQFDSWVGKVPWRRGRLPTPVFLGFPGGSDGRESACSAGDPGLIPGLESPWRRAWLPTPVFLPGESPWTEEPDGLQSTGSQRVRHDWTTKHSTEQTLLNTWFLYFREFNLT